MALAVWLLAALSVCPAGYKQVGEMCRNDKTGQVFWIRKQINGGCLYGDKARPGVCAIFKQGG